MITTILVIGIGFPILYALYVIKANDVATDKLLKKEAAARKFLESYDFTFTIVTTIYDTYPTNVEFSVLENPERGIPSRIFYYLLKRAYHGDVDAFDDLVSRCITAHEEEIAERAFQAKL